MCFDRLTSYPREGYQDYRHLYLACEIVTGTNTFKVLRLRWPSRILRGRLKLFPAGTFPTEGKGLEPRSTLSDAVDDGSSRFRCELRSMKLSLIVTLLGYTIFLIPSHGRRDFQDLSCGKTWRYMPDRLTSFPAPWQSHSVVRVHTPCSVSPRACLLRETRSRRGAGLPLGLTTSLSPEVAGVSQHV